MKKYNLGHQYADKYITTPYHSIDFMDEGLDLYRQFEKIKTLRIEVGLNPDSKDIETDLRKFYEGVSGWISAIDRDKIVFLVERLLYDLLIFRAGRGSTELSAGFFGNNEYTLSFRGILIDIVKKTYPALSDYEKRYTNLEFFGVDDPDPDMAEWDREFAEYLDRLKNEKQTK